MSFEAPSNAKVIDGIVGDFKLVEQYDLEDLQEAEQFDTEEDANEVTRKMAYTNVLCMTE